MKTFLKTVIVDDSQADSIILRDLLSNSASVHVTHVFTNPKEFIEQAPGLEMDLCMLDVAMPGIDGITLAQMIPNKPVIFVTGNDNCLRDAINVNPIDIVTKPVNKYRLDHAIERACKLLRNNMEYAVFCVAECKHKIKIHLSDIVFVRTDEVDPRHKIAALKNGLKYTLMDCSLDNLLEIAPDLIQVNKAELVSLEAIQQVDYDVISLSYMADGKQQCKEVTLGRAFKESFRKKVFFNDMHHGH